jgi:hypothetical protein
MPSFEALLSLSVALAAAAVGWRLATWSGPPGSRRRRTVLFVSFVVLFTLGSSALLPRARAWKQERDVEELLRDEPLFAAVLEDEPSLREPLRSGLLGALRSGRRGEAVPVGQRVLSPALWRYVPRASNAAAVDLGRALAATLADLRSRDPQQCYRFLFPGVAGPVSGGLARDERLLAALGSAALSARDGSAEPLDRRAARRQVDAAFARLRERHGRAVDVLTSAQSPGVDRAGVCAMTIELYSEIAALPPEAGGPALRHVLGPAEPDGTGDAPPGR